LKREVLIKEEEQAYGKGGMDHSRSSRRWEIMLISYNSKEI